MRGSERRRRVHPLQILIVHNKLHVNTTKGLCVSIHYVILADNGRAVDEISYNSPTGPGVQIYEVALTVGCDLLFAL